MDRDHVRLNDVVLFAHLGVTEAERQVGQRIHIDLDLEMDLDRPAETDVLGDTVNVAARIESLNRQLGTMILASADTLLATDGWVTKGTHLLRGRRRPIEVYTPEVATDGALPCVEALISMS